MADDTPAPTTGATNDTAPEAAPDTTDAVVAQADNPDAVKNALASERKAAKEAQKRAEAAEAKVAEYEEANKSEIEKLAARADKADQAKADAEARLLRFEVAAEKQVPQKLVPLLTASSKQDLEVQADLILENAASSPPPDFDGGARQVAPEPKSPEQAHSDLLVHELFGRPKTM